MLDPELAAIQERVRLSQFLQGERSNGRGGGPETVMLKVKWKPHPQDPDGEEDEVQYKYRRVCVARYSIRCMLMICLAR